MRHAPILLKADADGPAWTDARLAERFSVSIHTVRGIRQRLVEQSLDAALTRKKQDHPSRQPRFDGEGEERRIALRCSTPPAGQARRTLLPVAEQAGALDMVETIRQETVQQT